MTQDSLMQVAIMGTGAVPLPAGLDDFLAGWDIAPLDSPERSVLLSGLLLHRMALAGREPGACGAETPLSPPESLAYLGDRAEFFLSALLAGKMGNLLPEFLGAMARAKKIVRPVLVAQLLDFGNQKPLLRSYLRLIGGERMKWLAGFREDWQWALGGMAERWEDVAADHRIEWLEAHFAENPSDALEQIAETWKGETPDLRRKVCLFLARYPSNPVENFLEGALQDSRKEVREAAAESLAHFPDSNYSQKVGKLLSQWLKLEKKFLRSVFTVLLPDDYPSDLAVLGIAEKVQVIQGGAKANWLCSLVGRSQPAHWRAILGENLLNGWSYLEQSEWKDAFLAGWAQVAARSQDKQMVDALLKEEYFTNHLGLLDPIIAQLSPSHLDHVLKSYWGKGTAGFRLHGMPLLRLLQYSTGPLLPETAVRLLPVMRALIPGDAQPYTEFAIHQVFELLALRFPVSLVAETSKGWPTTHAHWVNWEKVVLKFSQTVQSRAEMLASIQA